MYFLINLTVTLLPILAQTSRLPTSLWKNNPASSVYITFLHLLTYLDFTLNIFAKISLFSKFQNDFWGYSQQFTYRSYWLEQVYLLIHYANDGVSLAAECGLCYREVFPQSEILNWASSSVHLDTIIFKYCLQSCIAKLWITDTTNQLSMMGEHNVCYYNHDKYTYSPVKLLCLDSPNVICVNYPDPKFAKFQLM